MKENKINEDDSPEEVERKKMYAKLCANKKPYFFAYNYSYLKTEYDAFIKNAQSNAMSLYKKDLQDTVKTLKEVCIDQLNREIGSIQNSSDELDKEDTHK